MRITGSRPASAFWYTHDRLTRRKLATSAGSQSRCASDVGAGCGARGRVNTAVGLSSSTVYSAMDHPPDGTAIRLGRPSERESFGVMLRPRGDVSRWRLERVGCWAGISPHPRAVNGSIVSKRNENATRARSSRTWRLCGLGLLHELRSALAFRSRSVRGGSGRLLCEAPAPGSH